MHLVIIFASTTNGLFQIDNYYKTALPGESVHFDMTLVNNEVNRETFLIHHVWEGSVLWLPMDLVDNQVYDSSQFGNNGAVNATPVDGIFGNALYFNETYLEIPDSHSLDVLNQISLMAWIKTDGSGMSFRNRIIDKWGENSDPGGWALDIWDDAGVVGFEVRIGDPFSGQGLAGTRVATDNLWHLVIATFDDETNTVKLYVDGTLDASSTLWTYPLLTNPRPLRIGSFYSGGNYFNGIIDEVRIFNRALTAEEIGWLYNNSWSESLSRYTVELEPGESTQVTFSVKVPENARAGLVKFLLTVFPTSNPESIDTQTVTVEVLPKYGVEVSLDENEKRGQPGEILNFQAAIRNLGNIEDTYDIQADGGEGWNLSLPAESITVPAEEVGSFNFSVTVPLNALPWNYTSFRIQAASRGNQSLTTNVNGAAIATATYRFNITSDPELRQASPGSEAIFSLEITNLGTAPDTIGLEIENLIGWDIKVDPSSISLEIEETGKTTVRVRVPENALIGQTNTIKIHAVSSSDPTVSANSSISIEIVTPFWDIPDVRFIVGLSIGVLVGATLISTIILRRAKINRKENRRS